MSPKQELVNKLMFLIPELHGKVYISGELDDMFDICTASTELFAKVVATCKSVKLRVVTNGISSFNLTDGTSKNYLTRIYPRSSDYAICLVDSDFPDEDVTIPYIPGDHS